MQLRIVITILCSVVFFGTRSQVLVPINGVYSPTHTLIAFSNAHLVVSPDEQIENGVLIIQDGKIIDAGEKVEIPENAVVFDLNGKYIYPSFIDLYSNYGMPDISPTIPTKEPQFLSPNNGTLYWNDAIHPQIDAARIFEEKSKAAKSYYKKGVGAVLTHKFNGIMRGKGALVLLNKNKNGSAIIKPKIANICGFGKGNSSQIYPTSLMGSIALFRQAMYDAEWYANSEKNPVNYSLQAIVDTRKLPYIFAAHEYRKVLQAGKLGEEFGLDIIAVSGGDSYKRLEEIKNANIRLVVPLYFPVPFDVSDPMDAQFVSLHDMKHWELAPANPALLFQNQIPFALTTHLTGKDFWKNLRLAIQYGLPANEALRALTVTPAHFLGISNTLGTLEKGKIANFFISDIDIFIHKGNILENWVGGQRFIINNAMTINPAGMYNLNFNEHTYQLNIKQTRNGLIVTSSLGASNAQPQKGKIIIENNLLTIYFQIGNSDCKGPIRMVGKVNYQGKIIDGQAQDANGNWFRWSAVKQSDNFEKPETLKPLALEGKITYPNMAYGDTVLPQPSNYYIANVMIWTCDSLGKFKGAVIVEDGKIAAVGKKLSNPESYKIIDGTGMHLTPGIIDEHSHIALMGGVNEAGQNNSAEVRIGDVLNPDDINIYRQLAGGVTTAQLLHGSANPIGGQAQIIKMRWGMGAEGLKFIDAPKSIKFALGENVKQSNWDKRNSIRFPQTRMGIEQVYIDAFSRAKAYQHEWETTGNTRNKRKKDSQKLPRRDLEMEALVEILNDKRYITCHSYIQSEIRMLMDIADSLGFRINTFTHILEGYKVLNRMNQHGVNASTFSDWWAYKYEVKDAIPYNAALLQQHGINTAINSDDAEMGRRLNQEAAKTVKYGGISEEEALNMITINPAKMLHIDHRVGSISIGKDADLVLWTNNPLSIYAHPKMVMIDGAVYYSEERNAKLIIQNKAERKRLILKMLESKENGSKVQEVEYKKQKLYHCNSFEEEVNY